MTCRRDRLPGEIEGHYLHKKTDSSDKKKLACFLNPVVATKNTEKLVEMITGEDGGDIEHIISKVFQCVHVSFHYTSLCNTRNINA